MIHEFSVRSREPEQVVELTDEVAAAVQRSGVRAGVCVVSVLHTTAGVLVNENDPGFQFDLLGVLRTLVPESSSYRHDDGNAHAHIRASLIGSSKSFIIRDGKLALGTWQRIFLAEFDGPRERRVSVGVTGET
jgi:secondary thiamine-phosphate synthase enzyme